FGLQYSRGEGVPWSAAGRIPVSSFPFAYGLAFLLPLQIGFSCWFFFLLSRVELVLVAAYGHTDVNGFPYAKQQGVGAALGSGLIVLWMARSHLARAGRAALGLAKADDAGEALSYRTAV